MFAHHMKITPENSIDDNSKVDDAPNSNLHTSFEKRKEITMKRSKENGIESSRGAGDCMRHFDTFEFIVVGFYFFYILLSCCVNS